MKRTAKKSANHSSKPGRPVRTLIAGIRIDQLAGALAVALAPRLAYDRVENSGPMNPSGAGTLQLQPGAGALKLQPARDLPLPTAPRPMPCIEASLDELNRAINEAHGVTGALTQRLDPICIGDNPNTCSAGAPAEAGPPRSPLILTIEDATANVRGVIARLATLLSRIQLRTE